MRGFHHTTQDAPLETWHNGSCIFSYFNTFYHVLFSLKFFDTLSEIGGKKGELQESLKNSGKLLESGEKGHRGTNFIAMVDSNTSICFILKVPQFPYQFNPRYFQVLDTPTSPLYSHLFQLQHRCYQVFVLDNFHSRHSHRVPEIYISINQKQILRLKWILIKFEACYTFLTWITFNFNFVFYEKSCMYI